jgi:hypothetical protein
MRRNILSIMGASLVTLLPSAVSNLPAIHHLRTNQPVTRLPPLCVNCKFFKQDPFVMNKYGKCVKFPKENDNLYFLVNGRTETPSQDYYYCTTSRSVDSMCGPEGKLFELKS